MSPAIIMDEHPLSNVDDVFNAIVVKGNALGDAMFYGRGAGKLPTASAVVADVIDIAKHPDFGTKSVWVRQSENNVMNIEDSQTKYLVRVKYRNAQEAKKYIESVFGKVKYVELPSADNEFAFVTDKASEAQLNSNISALDGIGSISGVVNKVRIELE